MTTMQISVPDIGDFQDVEVIEVLVAVGDTIRPEQSLITVESDKASLEIPASHGGVVTAVSVKLGDKINQGDVILTVQSADTAPAAPAAPVLLVEEAEPAPAAPAPAAAPAVAVAEAPTPAPASSPAMHELRVPDIGDFQDVEVIEVLVAVGDSIEAEQSLITVESDKASLEIPASHGGKLEYFALKIGDKINKGDLIGTVQSSASAAVPAPAPTPAPAAATPAPVATTATAPQAPQAPVAAPSSSAAHAGQLPHASPSVRKYARELGVLLEQVTGSGHKGRITQADVQAHTRRIMQDVATGRLSAAGGNGPSNFEVSDWPQVDFSKFGEVERQALSRIKKLSGSNLHRNWVRIPHVTNNDVADITELEALRMQLNAESAKAKSDTKVTMLAFLIKACVAALKAHPTLNASLDGDELVLKKYYHIGFAADTPNGLVVPVIKNADTKGIVAISQELGELSAKARSGKLSPADMQGASFSISSLGGIGGGHFTPIINAPEVAILGVGRNTMQPVWDGAQFQPRLMLPLSLSYDHRVIDGAEAARFNAFLGRVLADFRRVML